MAAAESASASLGPRYAPEDPTLPKPWTGLIDGSTGLQYYWNPETNVTQYERPAAAAAAGAPPPLPSGRPPTATTPKMASIPAPRVLQQNGTGLQTGQQVLQQTSQLMQQSQSHNQQTYPQPVQQFSQPQQQLPLSGQQLPHNQLVHQPSHMQPGQQAQHQQPGQQIHPQQPVQQMHYQQMPFSQMQQIPYSQTQQVPHSQVQQPPPHQMLNQTGQHAGFHREEAAPQQGKQVGYSSSYAQPSGAIPSTANSSAPNSQFQVPQAGAHSLQVQQQIGGSSSVSGPQSAAPLLQIQQSVDAIQQQQQFNGMTKSSNQMGQVMGNNSMPIRPPVRLNEHGESLHGRARDEFYGNSPREMPSMGLQQPKLAQLPIASNLQETRTSVIHPQNFAPGHAAGFNMAPVRPMSNMYNHAVASRPFPNAVPMRSSPHMLGAADHLDVSATEVYRRQHEVTAMGENVPAPFMTFETTGFPPEILREMHFAGFLSPTPIQAQTWPVALQGRDIVAIAKTGSGKTLGYIIPAFLHLRRQRNNPQIGPTVLVLAPTRELATQIQDEAIKFGRSSGISCTCLYGGAPKGPQLREIERGADIIIATPGRLNDILEMNKINFCQVSFLVLDEADRMLDMGFEPQIRKVVNEIPPHRQTLMYTATWPKEVRKIAGDLLCNPVQVNIGNVDELAANKAITQYVEVVPPMDKQRRLEQILRSQERGSKIIIFCSTKKLCDQLTHSVGRSFGAIAIHGDKSQGERDWALNQFRSGKLPILVATDVAARGLDVKDIRVVINYDFPTGVEDYVHRIGRTGRAGATGIAYTFFSDQDWKYAADLIKILEGANQRVPPEVREMATRGAPVFSKGRGGNGHLDSGGGRWDSGGGRGGRGGGGGFGGHGGRTDHFGGRGGRTDHFGGRDFGGLGRDFGGRASRGGRGFGGPGGWGRGGPGQHDRHGYVDGRGRGRFDNRRAFGERSRDRSYSRSPDRGRARGYDRSRSSSRSRRRSRSRSRSYSRSRSRSRSSRSTSYDRFDRPQGQNTTRAPRVSGFDVLPPAGLDALPQAGFGAPPTAGFNAPPPSGFDAHPPSGSLAVPAREMSPMSPGAEHTGTLRSDLAHKAPDADDGGGLNDGGGLTFPAAITEP